jgi:HSP20 family protein
MATLVRWNPMREMMAMQNVMDRVFEETWRNARANVASVSFALDIHETEGAYTITASLPGVNAESVNVSLNDDVLTVSGELTATTQPENSRALLQERVYGKFSRSLRIPQAIIADQVEATIDNGVLTLTLPKSPETQPRQIPVRVGLNGSPSSN